MTEIVTVTGLGHRGDGIAGTDDGELYIPFALPGERVEIERDGDRGRIVRLIEASPQRQEALCRHFGVCGGCVAQHLAPEAYLAWKREMVVTALRQHGVDAEVGPTIAVAGNSRRRASFTLRRIGGEVVLGYHERASHRLVGISECPVLLPAIARALPRLKAMLAPLAPAKGALSVQITALDDGLDVALEGARPPAPRLMAQLAAAASETGVLRLSVAGEPVFMAGRPTINVGGVAVELPPGAFLQAVAAAEAAMADLVAEGVRGARRIADLYAGIGTFTLRLARSARVTAVEGDGAAVAALASAARSPGLKPVETMRRDLRRAPLGAGELDRFDAVVFDPPRAGAVAQAGEIARSSVRQIVAVSCNPATLARDLRLLVDGGYTITRITPLDQFLFSPHVEVVALLRRR